jgi:hypothetical protein
VLEEIGWKEGDDITISAENGSLVLSKKDTISTKI